MIFSRLARRNFFFLYLSVFITMIGFGMVFPMLPFYAQTFGATDAQIAFLAVSFSIGQFLMAPVAGRLSDRFGRKSILAISLFGASLAFFLFGSAKSLPWLFFSRALHGVFSAGVFPIATAYIGDLAAKEERIKYMSRLTGVLSLGFIIGPAITAIFSSNDYALPFYMGAFVAFLSAVLIIILLPESLTQKAEKFIVREGLVNIKAIFSSIKGEFGALFFVLFAWSFAIANFQVALPLFAEDKFSFSVFQIGLIFTVTGAIAVIIQWFFLPKIVRIISEIFAVALGALIMALGQFLIAVSPAAVFIFIFVSVSTAGGSILRPTVNAILSRETKEGQGTTMGLAFSFESLGRIAGPLMAAFLMTAFGAQGQFILTALVLIFSFLFVVRYIKKIRKKPIQAAA